MAGLAILWWEQALRDNPCASGELVRSRLLASCRPSGFAPGVVTLNQQLAAAGAYPKSSPANVR